MKLENVKAQMRKGVLELCILSIIEKKEMYPSDILNALKEAHLIVVEGTLYPILSRLIQANLLQFKWVSSSIGPPRKYYSITTHGTLFLEELSLSWQTLSNAVTFTLNGKNANHE